MKSTILFGVLYLIVLIDFSNAAPTDEAPKKVLAEKDVDTVKKGDDSILIKALSTTTDEADGTTKKVLVEKVTEAAEKADETTKKELVEKVTEAVVKADDSKSKVVEASSTTTLKTPTTTDEDDSDYADVDTDDGLSASCIASLCGGK